MKFEICDATQADFPSCTFDVIVMRSALMHLPYDKKYKVVENSFVRTDFFSMPFVKN